MKSYKLLRFKETGYENDNVLNPVIAVLERENRLLRQ